MAISSFQRYQENNVGSVMPVNENEHFKNRLTIWLCTKNVEVNTGAFSVVFTDIVPNTSSWFYWDGRRDQEIGGKPVSNLLQATC